MLSLSFVSRAASAASASIGYSTSTANIVSISFSNSISLTISMNSGLDITWLHWKLDKNVFHSSGRSLAHNLVYSVHMHAFYSFGHQSWSVHVKENLRSSNRFSEKVTKTSRLSLLDTLVSASVQNFFGISSSRRVNLQLFSGRKRIERFKN